MDGQPKKKKKKQVRTSYFCVHSVTHTQKVGTIYLEPFDKPLLFCNEFDKRHST